MEMNPAKIIVFLVFVILGGFFIYAGQTGVFATGGCEGWQVINPLCWLGEGVNLALELVGLIAGSIFILLGLLALVISSDRLKYLVGFVIFGTVATVLWLIPADPIPLIDELLTTGISLFMAYKTAVGDGGSGRLGF